MERLGFIGLGTMGHPMARRLLKNGYSLTIYNRTLKKTMELQAQGADVVSTPMQVAQKM